MPVKCVNIYTYIIFLFTFTKETVTISCILCTLGVAGTTVYSYLLHMYMILKASDHYVFSLIITKDTSKSAQSKIRVIVEEEDLNFTSAGPLL